MNVELTKDELALVCDGLASLPLARSYNLFTRLALILNPNPATPDAPKIPDPPSEDT